MITVERLDPRSRSARSRFLELPFRLYGRHPEWVPPPFADARLVFDRRRHPFYEHSDADFFLAVRDGRTVARVAALENRPFNAGHGTHQAQFCLLEGEDDAEVFAALFGRALEWARGRGLTEIVGPKGFSAFDGYGLLVDGFERRQMMTMTSYNPPSYPRLLEGLGFKKAVDFVSCYLPADAFRMPERARAAAERARERGALRVHRFRSRREIRSWAGRIGAAYNRAFVANWEYYPLTEREIAFVLERVLLLAEPGLIKVITHGEDVVGFLFAFPDVSAALQRARGRLFPFGLLDLWREVRRTPWLTVNGAGILPEFQGRGGNALLYLEIQETVQAGGRFRHAEITQVAETAIRMRRDLEKLGARPWKTHRVYTRGTEPIPPVSSSST